jgi:hypothetical protein
LKGDIMKAKKYWILVVALTTLCMTGWYAKTTAKSTKENSSNQCEYGCYLVFTVGDSTAYSWTDPEKHINTLKGHASELWIKCGFSKDRKDPHVADWLNFLGKKGWELVCMEVSQTNTGSITYYWFKRAK